MTRSGALIPPVSANGKVRRTPRARPEPVAMKFLVFEDNSGGYHWTIVADGGETLVRSSSFASYEQARQAAHVVHAGAGSASFEQGPDNPPLVDLPARRNAVSARDRLDAERWLDEGGSFSEAVTR
jgi:uncharacterized protein YegP (UPF0339 family)